MLQDNGIAKSMVQTALTGTGTFETALAIHLERSDDPWPRRSHIRLSRHIVDPGMISGAGKVEAVPARHGCVFQR